MDDEYSLTPPGRCDDSLGLVVETGYLTLSPTVTIETTGSIVLQPLSVSDPWLVTDMRCIFSMTP
ncbi:hypothetical protein [Natronorubrum sp. DTA7]|uniref:hypothetical protein n=1 Tax=Natronorubrum sp. DTA7 TaxID=3447016 RepID=UPI003F872EDF